MAEVRTQSEGAVYWVQASGVGTGWATASAPESGLFGYVRSFSYTSAQTHVAVADRGVPNHWKRTSRAPVDLNISFAWTGSQPTPATASGASVAMFHLEYKADKPEESGTGIFFQFHGVPINSVQFSEGEQEDTITLSMQALGMNGPTASGYMVAG